MGSVLGHLMVGLPGLEVPGYLPMLAEKGLKSVCIYGENVESEAQLAKLVADIRAVLGPRAIIAIDEEGGEVTRVDYRTGSKFAGNGFLGRLGNPDLTARDARLIAQRLNRLQINLNLAPVADVNLEPANPVIGLRSFGSQQDIVAEHVAAFVWHHEAAGVGTTLKHFPGHGNTLTDSHHGLPRVEGGLDELIATQMRPFEQGIKAGSAAVMLGHLDLGLSAPSSMSAEVVDYLRTQLGFGGLVLTDAMDMGALGPRSELPKNAIRALLAGVDLVCMGPRTELAELLEIEELGSELQLQNSDLLARSQARISAFENREKVTPVDAVEPGYPFSMTERSIRNVGQVVRFQSATNLAVGQVPWYASVSAPNLSSVEELQELILAESRVTMVLFRTAMAAHDAVNKLPEGFSDKVLAVIPEPPVETLNCESIVTFGTALPQSAMVLELLSQRQDSNG